MTWSILSNCDICSVKLKITPLSEHHRLLITDLHRYFNYEASYSVGYPQKACTCCLLRIESVWKNLFVTQKYLNGNMQTNPHDHPKEDNEPPNDEPHQYNCECHECQIKFGSLPLLVQVIECQEKSSQENSTQEPNADLPEPSTSSAANCTPKKSMTCPHCDKSFTHRGDLNKHVRTHTGEQPYTCQVCNRKFAHTSNLNRHLRVHTGDRPFVCSVCNKNFSRKDKLDMHKKTKLCKKIGETSS